MSPEIVTSATEAGVTVPLLVTWQPFASVTVTLKVPAVETLMHDVVAPVLHEKVDGPDPPLALAHSLAEPPGQIVAPSTFTRGGGVTVTGMLHLAALLPAVTITWSVKPSLPLLAWPTFTCTEAPVLPPTNVAPELLAVNDHR